MPDEDIKNELVNKKDPYEGMSDKERLLARASEYLDKASDALTRKDFEKAFMKVVEAVNRTRAAILATNDARLARIKDGKDGKEGKKGDKGDKGDTVVGPKGEDGYTPRKGVDYFDGKDGSPDTAQQVRDKLETLEGEERLDASAIKNLPKAVQEYSQTSVGIHGPLWSLIDVDVEGITAGQSIKWTGVRWIPFTPAGTGNAAYNEVAGGSGTAWTLDNEPTAGTLRVYANGQRLTETTDYSISGTDLTTVLSWSAGTVLVDYEYA